MLADIMDMITYPVVQFLLMLKDERITAYLGVSVLGIAVTCMIIMIVFNALVNRVDAGGSAASILRTQDIKRQRAERADRAADRESYEYYERNRERSEKYARIYKDRHK